ncbi:MAG: D-alanine--D-alanine ligase family protein [Bacillota bacterium]|jgi:D-alanine-D-alanine ligase
MQKIQVGVAYGGRSVEHEVSIISALQAIRALDKEKYEPVPLYISKQGIWYTGDNLLDIRNYRDINMLLSTCKKIYFSQNHHDFMIVGTEATGMFKKTFSHKIDVVMPVIHGTHGEDGCLQGLLELSGVPYTGPAVLGSACGMDKIIMKAVLKEAGLPTPDYHWFYMHQWHDDQEQICKILEEKISYPMIVKPADLGSSIGVTAVDNIEELLEAVSLAGSFANRILIEKFINPLREINCSVLGCPENQETSVCEEPIAAAKFLSYGDKYLCGGTKGMSGAQRRIPADLDESITQKIQDYARRAFVALDEYGVCRIDFLMNADSNEIFVNEINTIPGSLSFYLWEPTGKTFSQLLDDLIRLALKRSRKKEKMIFSYASNILAQGGGFKGSKK